VEVLVKEGAPLFTKNKEGLTACDLAAAGGHTRVAHVLEAFMVLADYVNNGLGSPAKKTKRQRRMEKGKKRGFRKKGEFNCYSILLEIIFFQNTST
jgi:hypothetical protein